LPNNWRYIDAEQSGPLLALCGTVVRQVPEVVGCSEFFRAERPGMLMVTVSLDLAVRSSRPSAEEHSLLAAWKFDGIPN
jgi:hypothetical protein